MGITIFENLKTTKNGYTVSIDQVLNRIQTGKSAHIVNSVRTLQDDDQRRALKSTLPCILFSGEFEQRKDSGLKKHSGFAILDFDHIKNVHEVKAQICKDKYTYSAFISPSGDGIKVLCRIPANPDQHSKNYLGLVDHFSKYAPLDTTSKNLSRICFESYDPEIYINKNAAVFEAKEQNPQDIDFGMTMPVKEKKQAQPLPTDQTERIKQIAGQMIREAQDGEKHETLLKASRLMGGVVAHNLISDHEAENFLFDEIRMKDIKDPKQALKTIQDGIKHGRSEPLTFEEYRKKSQERKSETFTSKPTAQKNPAGIVRLSDCREEMNHSFKHGKVKGVSTGFKALDPHFTIKKGEVTGVIGVPNSGKSEFFYQILLLQAIINGTKSAVFTPENYPAGEFYDTLIHTYLGMSTDRDYPNCCNADQYTEAQSFVNDHIFFVYPEEHTITEIEKVFNYCIDELGCELVMVDPYNQVISEQARNEREDQYLSKFLSRTKRYAIDKDIHYFLVAHPSKMYLEDGVYPCPTVYNFSGGSMFANKLDNIIAVHRPHFPKEKNNTEVQISIQKIKKQKLVGKPGDVYMDFDRATNRYWADGQCPMNVSPYKTNNREMLPLQNESDIF